MSGILNIIAASSSAISFTPSVATSGSGTLTSPTGSVVGVIQLWGVGGGGSKDSAAGVGTGGGSGAYITQTVACTAVIGGPIYVIPTATYNTGTVLTFVNDGSTTAPVSIQTADTVFSAGSGYINPNGVHVLAQYGQATFLKVGSTRWQLSGAGIV